MVIKFSFVFDHLYFLRQSCYKRGLKTLQFSNYNLVHCFEHINESLSNKTVKATETCQNMHIH